MEEEEEEEDTKRDREREREYFCCRDFFDLIQGPGC